MLRINKEYSYDSDEFGYSDYAATQPEARYLPRSELVLLRGSDAKGRKSIISYQSSKVFGWAYSSRLSDTNH